VPGRGELGDGSLDLCLLDPTQEHAHLALREECGGARPMSLLPSVTTATLPVSSLTTGPFCGRQRLATH